MSLAGPMMFDPRVFWGDEDVKLLDWTAIGVYLKLLSAQWEEGSIPGDPRRLRAILAGGLRSEVTDEVLEQALEFFEHVSEGRLANPRLAGEREDWILKREKDREDKSKAGIKSGESRRRKRDKARNRCSSGVEQVLNKERTEGEQKRTPSPVPVPVPVPDEEATQAPPPEPPAPSVDVRLKIFRKRNLLTEAECSRLAGLMDRDPLGEIGETPKVTDESAMRAERLARLASLWQVTSPLAGDGDGPFELWAEWRRQSRKKGGKSGPNDWRNEVECLRALQAPGRTPAEMLAGLRGARGNWRSFDYSYLEGENGVAKIDNRSREERRLAELNQSMRHSGDGAKPIDVKARLEILAGKIPGALSPYRAAVKSLDGSVEEVESALELTSSLVMADLPKLLGEERLAELRAKKEAAVLRHRKRLSGEQLERTAEEIWERLLRESAGVPELSLFSPDASEED